MFFFRNHVSVARLVSGVALVPTVWEVLVRNPYQRASIGAVRGWDTRLLSSFAMVRSNPRPSSGSFQPNTTRALYAGLPRSTEHEVASQRHRVCRFAQSC